MTRRTPSGHSAAEIATRKPIKQAISIVKRMTRRETTTGRQRNRELVWERVSAHHPRIAISHHLVAGPDEVPPTSGTPGRRSRAPNDHAAVAVVGKSCAPTVPSLQNGRMQKLLALALLCFASVTAFSAPTPAGDWTEFRGPGGQGLSTAAGLPFEWSAAHNISWKQPVPGAGWSSPVVSRGQVFLTTATMAGSELSAGLHVFCFEATTGRIAWHTEVFATAGLPPQPLHQVNTPACPTPLVDGERLYVYFGHHGAACLDRAGKIIWRNQRLRFDPVPGNGGSPILAGDRLIYVAECATAPFVMALDTLTGKTLWKIPRDLPSKMKFSFGTPLLIAIAGRTQIVIPGPRAVSAFDPTDGREIWSVRYRGDGALAPRPVFAHGLVFVSAGYLRSDLLAIRPDGRGDVTDTHVVWRASKGAPLGPALLALGDELYAVNHAGLATCWDARTGQVHWQEKIGGPHSAAPLAANGRLYFLAESGTTTVLKAGREFAVLATNLLGETAFASPAAIDGALFIRTTHHLYRIGETRPH